MRLSSLTSLFALSSQSQPTGVPDTDKPAFKPEPLLHQAVAPPLQHQAVAPARRLDSIETEFQVNTHRWYDQAMARIASLANGDFVVVWQSNHQDGSDYGTYAQRYGAAGEKMGSEFRVNAYTAGNQYYPSITSLADGGFVVAWHSNHQDGSKYGTYAQRYGATGEKVGGEFRVNTYTALDQVFPSITSLTDGGFVVAWHSEGQDGSYYGVYAQRYAANGEKDGGEFRVNTYVSGGQVFPSITSLTDGGFVVAWDDWHEGSSGHSVHTQRYDANGDKAGAEFKVNTYTLDGQQLPSITSLATGDFVITWHSNGQDGSSYGVYAQRYTINGDATSGEFRVNTHTQDSQRDPSICSLKDGGFVITWNSHDQDGDSWGIYAQRYNASGETVGSEFRVNSHTINGQERSSVTGLDDGGFIITWRSQGQDGSDLGVYAKRYDCLGNPIPVGQLGCLSEDVNFQTIVPPRVRVNEFLSSEITVDISPNRTDAGEFQLPEVDGVNAVYRDGKITVSGPREAVNLALAGILFTPEQQYYTDHAIAFSATAYAEGEIEETWTWSNTIIAQDNDIILESQTAVVGQAWSFTPASSLFAGANLGSLSMIAYEAQSGRLLDGIAFDAFSRSFSWTPTEPSEKNIVLKVTDGQGYEKYVRFSLVVTTLTTTLPPLEIDAIRAALAVAQNDMSALESTLGTLVANHSHTSTRVDELNDTCATKIGLGDVSSELTQTQATLAGVQSSLSDLERNAATKDALDSVNTTLTQAQQAITALQSGLAVLESGSATTVEMSRLRSDAAQNITALQTRVGDLEVNRATQTALASVSTSLGQAQETITTLQSSIADLQRDTAKKSELSSVNATLVQTQATLAGVQSSLSDLERNAATKDALDSVNTTLTQAQQSITVLQGSLASLESAQATKVDLSGVNATLVQTQATLAGVQSSLSDLQRDAAKKSELSSVNVTLVQTRETLAQAQQAIATAQDRLTALSIDVSDLDRLKASKTELRDLSDDHDTTKSRVSSVERTKANQTEFSSLRVELDATTARTTGLEGSRATVTDVMLLTQDHGSTKTRVAALENTRATVSQVTVISQAQASTDARVSAVETTRARQADLDALSTDHGTTKTRVSNLEVNSASKTSVTTLTSRVSSVESRVDGLETGKADQLSVDQTVGNLRRESEANATALGNRVDNLAGQVQAVQDTAASADDIARLDTRIDGVITAGSSDEVGGSTAAQIMGEVTQLRESTQADVSRLQTADQHMAGNMTQVKSDVVQLQDDRERLDRDTQKTAADLVSTNSSLRQGLLSMQGSLSGDISEAQAQTALLRTEASQNITQVRTANTAMQDQLDSFKNSTDSEFRSLQSSIASVQDDVSDVLDGLGEVSRSFQLNITRVNSTIASELAQVRLSTELVQNETERQASQLAGLGGSVQGVKEGVAQVRTDLTRNITDLTRDIVATTVLIQENTTRIEATVRELGQAQQASAQAVTTLEQKTADLDVAAFQERLRTSEAERNLLQQALAGNVSKLEATEGKLVATEQALAGNASKLEATERELVAVWARSNQTDQALQAERIRVTTLENEFESLKKKTRTVGNLTYAVVNLLTGGQLIATRTAFRTVFNIEQQFNTRTEIIGFNTDTDLLDLTKLKLETLDRVDFVDDHNGILIQFPGNQSILVRDVRRDQVGAHHIIGVGKRLDVMYLGHDMSSYNRTVDTVEPIHIALPRAIFSDATKDDFTMEPKQKLPSGRLTDLPDGLVYDPDSHVISGNLTEGQTVSIVMVATDPDAVDPVQSDAFTIRVVAKPVKIADETRMSDYNRNYKVGDSVQLTFPQSVFADPDSNDFVMDIKQKSDDGSLLDLPMGLTFYPETRKLMGKVSSPMVLNLVLLAVDKDTPVPVETDLFTITVMATTTQSTTPITTTTTPITTTTTNTAPVIMQLEPGETVEATEKADILVLPTAGNATIMGFDVEADALRIDQLASPPRVFSDIRVQELYQSSDGRRMTIVGTRLIFPGGQVVDLPGVDPKTVAARHILDSNANPINQAPILGNLGNRRFSAGGNIDIDISGVAKDPDEGDSLTIAVKQKNGEALPGWLRFNANTLTLSGVAPDDDVVVHIEVVATDSHDVSVSTFFDMTIETRTMPVVVENDEDSPWDIIGGIGTAFSIPAVGTIVSAIYVACKNYCNKNAKSLNDKVWDKLKELDQETAGESEEDYEKRLIETYRLVVYKRHGHNLNCGLDLNQTATLVDSDSIALDRSFEVKIVNKTIHAEISSKKKYSWGPFTTVLKLKKPDNSNQAANGNGASPDPGQAANGNGASPDPGQASNGNGASPDPGQASNGNGVLPGPSQAANGNVSPVSGGAPQLVL